MRAASCAIQRAESILVNPTPVELNPYLKARGESQLRAKHGFERKAGWRFGLIFGVLVLLAGYTLDAIQQLQAHSQFWWLYFAWALVTLAPLAFLAGGISGYVNWLLKLPIWAGWTLVAGWCALNIPFTLSQLAFQWLDPALRVADAAPRSVGDAYGMLAMLSIFAGSAVGLTQTVAVGWAWKHATNDLEFTLGSWMVLFTSLPLALGFGLLIDHFAQQPLRAPLQMTHALIESGLNDPPNLDTSTQNFERATAYREGQRWRNLFTSEYTLHLAAREPQAKAETYIDASFGNGNLLRCRISALDQFSNDCIDLKQAYSDYISEFLRQGAFECRGCASEISAQARAWQQTNARTLTAADTTRVLHRAGSGVSVRVRVADGAELECLFWGVNPIRIAACQ